jgi:outer membrane protein
VKNISLAINGVLLVAVAVLFYLHFSSASPSAAEASANDSIPKLNLNLPADLASKKILFINPDTINKYYIPIANTKKQVEQQVASYQATLDAKERAYQNSYMSAEKMFQEGKISEEMMPQVQADLQKLEREYMMSKNSFEAYQNQVLQDQDKMLKEVTAYFKEYSIKNGIDYILVSGNGGIAYGNESLDISKEMVKALNELYNAKQAAEKANPSAKKK